MAAELPLRLVGVVADAGIEDRLVLLAAPRERPALGERERAVALAVLPGRPDQADEPVRTRRLVEAEVEGGVLAPRLHGVTAAVSLRPPLEVLGGRRAVSFSEALGGAAHREGLEGEPHLVGVAEVVDGELAHARTAMGHVHGEPEALELAHCLAHRGDAHAERARKLLEAQRRARRELAGEDRLLQVHHRRLGHRLMAPPAGERGRLHGAIVSPV